MQQRTDTEPGRSTSSAERGGSPLGKIDITTDVQAALCKRGMAYVDKDGGFHLNRKGRRWLEKQVGRKQVRMLQTEALKRSQQSPEGERKQAWKDEKKKLDS